MNTQLTQNASMAENKRNITETVTRERDRLLNFIRRWVPEPSDAEDIVQDVFFELLESYRLPRPIEQMGAWLFKVARNRIIDRFRRKQTENALVTASSESSDASELLLDKFRPAKDAGPETAYACSVLMDQLLLAVDELPEEQRKVFIAHELEGRSFDEMAAESGLGVNTLLSRKRYAVQFLRRRLQAIYDEFIYE
jgi:RNA polymerase sigma factor (sigma-70 family)